MYVYLKKDCVWYGSILVLRQWLSLVLLETKNKIRIFMMRRIRKDMDEPHRRDKKKEITYHQIDTFQRHSLQRLHNQVDKVGHPVVNQTCCPNIPLSPQWAMYKEDIQRYGLGLGSKHIGFPSLRLVWLPPAQPFNRCYGQIIFDPFFQMQGSNLSS